MAAAAPNPTADSDQKKQNISKAEGPTSNPPKPIFPIPTSQFEGAVTTLIPGGTFDGALSIAASGDALLISENGVGLHLFEFSSGQLTKKWRTFSPSSKIAVCFNPSTQLFLAAISNDERGGRVIGYTPKGSCVCDLSVPTVTNPLSVACSNGAVVVVGQTNNIVVFDGQNKEKLQLGHGLSDFSNLCLFNEKFYFLATRSNARRGWYMLNYGKDVAVVTPFETELNPSAVVAALSHTIIACSESNSLYSLSDRDVSFQRIAGNGFGGGDCDGSEFKTKFNSIRSLAVATIPGVGPRLIILSSDGAIKSLTLSPQFVSSPAAPIASPVTGVDPALARTTAAAPGNWLTKCLADSAHEKVQTPNCRTRRKERRNAKKTPTAATAAAPTPTINASSAAPVPAIDVVQPGASTKASDSALVSPADTATAVPQALNNARNALKKAEAELTGLRRKFEAVSNDKAALTEMWLAMEKQLRTALDTERKRSSDLIADKLSLNDQLQTIEQRMTAERHAIEEKFIAERQALKQKAIAELQKRTAKSDLTERKLTAELHAVQQKLASTQRQLNEAKSNSELLCAVCTDRRRSIVFGPCNHFSCCPECSSKLLKCPLCREPINTKTPVHVS